MIDNYLRISNAIDNIAKRYSLQLFPVKNHSHSIVMSRKDYEIFRLHKNELPLSIYLDTIQDLGHEGTVDYVEDTLIDDPNGWESDFPHVKIYVKDGVPKPGSFQFWLFFLEFALVWGLYWLTQRSPFGFGQKKVGILLTRVVSKYSNEDCECKEVLENPMNLMRLPFNNR